MQEEQSLRDRIVEKLTNIKGAELEVTCNLTHNKQIELFTEEMGFKELGSDYIIERANMYKRLTCSFQGRARDDLKAIGMTPEFQPGKYSYDDS
jgi:uncharacterized protein (UPF0371 family)